MFHRNIWSIANAGNWNQSRSIGTYGETQINFY